MDNKGKVQGKNSAPKPKNIDNFNAYFQLKYNLQNNKNNCKHPITKDSFYCLKCQKSTCPKCDLKEHKNHPLYGRSKYLTYDESLFKDAKQETFGSFDLERIRDDFIDKIEKVVKVTTNKLENVKQAKLNEINNLFDELEKDYQNLQNNLDMAKKCIKDYYFDHQIFFSIDDNSNLDIRNTIFLMNFELIKVFKRKNEEAKSSLEYLNENIENFKTEIGTYFNNISDNINKISGCYPDYFKNRKNFEDFYSDIHSRIEIYGKHIKNIQNNVTNGVNNAGSFNYLGELVRILDLKNKRGIQSILTQLNNREEGNRTEIYQSSKKRVNPKAKIIISQYNSKFSQSPKSKKLNLKIKKTPRKNVSTGNLTLDNSYRQEDKKILVENKKDVSLKMELVQKYFAYSLVDIYNKHFANHSVKSMELGRRMYADYLKRNSELKEVMKPIVGTNEVYYFDKSLKKRTKLKLKLSKELSFYSKFPEGIRHIFLNEKSFYVTGGVDMSGQPYNIVLLYDLEKDELTRLPNMLYPHAYHTIEYIENYESLIVIGGEVNDTCEMFDTIAKVWVELPRLSFPRANTNLYFDEITNELYCLFGLDSFITDKYKFSDIVEVLELNNINNGWIRVEYYKSAMIDLKNNLTDIFPLSKGKILIRGVKEVRNEVKIYAIFDLDKIEILNVDKNLLSQIKADEYLLNSYSNY